MSPLLLLTACHMVPLKQDVVMPGDCSHPVIAQPAHEHTVDRTSTFDTGSDSELLSCVPVAPNSAGPFYKLYEIVLMNIKKGDIVDAYFQGEVTSEIPSPVMAGWYMTISQGDQVLHQYPAFGTNIVQHHLNIDDQLFWTSDRDADVTVTAWIYSANDDTHILNKYITVMQGYGSLRGMVMRPFLSERR